VKQDVGVVRDRSGDQREFRLGPGEIERQVGSAPAPLQPALVPPGVGHQMIE
jgi:hypothetical protein